MKFEGEKLFARNGLADLNFGLRICFGFRILAALSLWRSGSDFGFS
jgi:hypothetical protein